MIHQNLDIFTAKQIYALVQPDLESARSQSELKTRLQAKGYGLQSTETGLMLTAEPHHVPLFPIPDLKY
jgi:hypothetical protein